MKIQDLNISAASKSALNSIGLTMVSELAGQNYITLINKFTMKPKPWLAAIIPKKRKLSPRLTHSAFKTMRIVHKMDIL